MAFNIAAFFLVTYLLYTYFVVSKNATAKQDSKTVVNQYSAARWFGCITFLSKQKEQNIFITYATIPEDLTDNFRRRSIKLIEINSKVSFKTWKMGLYLPSEQRYLGIPVVGIGEDNPTEASNLNSLGL